MARGQWLASGYPVSMRLSGIIQEIHINHVILSAVKDLLFLRRIKQILCCAQDDIGSGKVLNKFSARRRGLGYTHIFSGGIHGIAFF
jgi:hypothetical protein